jgi:hypothetical protein
MIKQCGILIAFAGLTFQPNIAAAVPASAQAVNAQAAVAAPTVNINPDLIADKATALSQLLFSRELVQSQVSGVLSESLPKSMKSNADFALYEKEYPGLINAIVSAIKPAMLKAYDEKLPLLWFNMAQQYRDNFTPAEIGQLHGFYASPIGVRLIANMRRNTNVDNLLKAAIVNGEANAKVTAAAKAQTIEAIRKTNAQMTPADKLVVFRFENSPVGRKLTLFNPKMQKTQLDWDFYFTDAQLAEFALARGDAITDFTTKADAAKEAQAPSASAAAQ